MGGRKPLSDEERKIIIADYISLQNYSEVARKHNISESYVRKLVKNNPDSAKQCEQKQIDNTISTLEYMQSQHDTKKRIAEKLLKAIETKAENVDMFTNVKDLTTAYGIIVDKELKFAEIKSSFGEQIKSYNELPARVIGERFGNINRWIDDRKYMYYEFKGGRGSLKSSFCALKLIDQIMRHENFCGMAVRQIKDTLKDSVYNQIVWAIDELELTEEFHCIKSPLEIRRKKTGQIIYFRGADDPMKIKSIRPPKDMHIGVIWFEEKDQISKESVRNIRQSVMRGGDDIIVLSSYNTPISQQHYINKEALEINDKRIIHHSYYYDAPREWLGQPFFDEAEHTKQINERVYRHEYLGEATGTGANVFENVKIHKISDDEIKTFDRIYGGLDFGFYPDPALFNVFYYHSGSRKLYIFDEEKAFKLGNEAFSGRIDRWKKIKDFRIVADSAEPKSISDYKKYGFNITGAKKGSGSVDYGMKWLASLNEIIIDAERCPNAANEFLSYEYSRTKDGEIISGYPDKDDHSISAARYALEDIIKEKSGFIGVK